MAIAMKTGQALQGDQNDSAFSTCWRSCHCLL